MYLLISLPNLSLSGHAANVSNGPSLLAYPRSKSKQGKEVQKNTQHQGSLIVTDPAMGPHRVVDGRAVGIPSVPVGVVNDMGGLFMKADRCINRGRRAALSKTQTPSGEGHY